MTTQSQKLRLFYTISGLRSFFIVIFGAIYVFFEIPLSGSIGISILLTLLFSGLISAAGSQWR